MNKKIAIIGGRGTVGKKISKKALEKGYSVKMLTRYREESGSGDKVCFIRGDARNKDDIKELIKGCDAVINTGGHPKSEKPFYRTVTSHIIQGMKELGIKRYIVATGAFLTLNGDEKTFLNQVGANLFQLFFSPMMKEKEQEYELLKASSLDWTLIRLPFVVDKKGTGHIKIATKNMPGKVITNEDIASFLISQIDSKKYIRGTPFISN